MSKTEMTCLWETKISFIFQFNNIKSQIEVSSAWYGSQIFDGPYHQIIRPIPTNSQWYQSLSSITQGKKKKTQPTNSQWDQSLIHYHQLHKENKTHQVTKYQDFFTHFQFPLRASHSQQKRAVLWEGHGKDSTLTTSTKKHENLSRTILALIICLINSYLPHDIKYKKNYTNHLLL